MSYFKIQSITDLNLLSMDIHTLIMIAIDAD